VEDHGRRLPFVGGGRKNSGGVTVPAGRMDYEG
jgi:hypothetical protein